ncbi:hypothetical protein VM1G_11649 [Cytospora mali]|uniref:Uncharacterized protein n=1 Tax=Cytospora mali TaxID=578113 RepID=A0A194VYT2_CYTMA|nr:hypothetical protein VM1G_11649 [Valsa mali]
MRDDISENLDSDLLLHSLGSDSVICPVIVVFFFEFVIVHGFLVLFRPLLATIVADDGLFLFRKIEHEPFFLLLQAVEKALEDTDDEGGKVLAVHLGKRTPENEARLAESRISEVQRLLASLHEIHDIRLELLRANCRGDAAHGVENTTSEIQLIFAVLDLDEGAQGGHGVFEVGGEALLHGAGDGTQSASSGALDLEVGMSQEVANGSNELRSVLLHDIRVETRRESIQRSAGTAHDFNILLLSLSVGGAGTSGLDVVEDGLNKSIAVVRQLLCHLVGDAGQADESGVADPGVGVIEQTNDDGHDHLELGGEGLEQRHDDLARRQVARKLVKEGQSSASGGDVVLVLIIIDLGENLHAFEGQLGAHVFHGLDLHAAVADGLGQEGKSLATNLVVGVLVGSKIAGHEGHQVPQVRAKKDWLVGKELLEDLKRLFGTLIVAVLNGILQHVDHGGDEVLDGRHDCLVLLGLNQHQDGTNRHHGVNADVSALRVLDGIGKEGKQLANLVGKGRRVFLQNGIDYVGADLAMGNIGGVAGKGEERRDKFWPRVLIGVQIEAGNTGDDARLRVPAPGVLLFHSSLDQMLTDAGLLLSGYLLPVFWNESGSLDGGLLAKVDIVICADDLDKEEQRLGLRVEVLLELRRDGLDPLGISCKMRQEHSAMEVDG